MKVTATVQFLPMKAAADYLHVSTWWLRNNGTKKGFPRRIVLSARKVGYWKHELDEWLVRMSRQTRRTRKSVA